MDVLDKNLSILVHLKPQDLYDMGEDDDVTFHECEPFEQQNLETLFSERRGYTTKKVAFFNWGFVYYNFV